MAKQANNAGNTLGFEAQLWAAAKKLHGNMEPSDYKHVVLGLIFLKYISDAFESKRADLLADEFADPEDPEEYLAENVFWVPKHGLRDFRNYIHPYEQMVSGFTPDDHTAKVCFQVLKAALASLAGERP